MIINQSELKVGLVVDASSEVLQIHDKDIEQAKQSGMNDHVSKPIDVEKMYNTLIKWIEVSELNQAIAIDKQEAEREDAQLFCQDGTRPPRRLGHRGRHRLLLQDRRLLPVSPCQHGLST